MRSGVEVDPRSSAHNPSGGLVFALGARFVL